VEPLSAEVVQGLRHDRATRERKIAVCAGGAHLDPVDRAEILVILAGDPDEMVSEHAQNALLAQPLESLVEALKRSEAMPALFVYAAENLAGKPGVTEALLGNVNCPARCLITSVPHFSAGNMQDLMDTLDRVSDSNSLASALLHSSQASPEHKRILQELLGPETPMDEDAFAEAAADAEPDPVKRVTLLQRLAKMNVSQRVQFAIKGGSEARRTLIRDSNKVVQRAVLQSPRLTDQEVEAFAAMSSLTDEILRLIANNRNFRKNYTVVRNLMSNAKTPLDVSLHMLPILNAIDLKRLTTNKNVPETLRTTAHKLMRTRTELKK